MIKTILCIQENSNYYKIPGLDLWGWKRNAYNYKGTDPVIAHPPCQQWSKLRSFAKENIEEKELAMYCLEIIQKNGGILEHPQGSIFFKYAGIKPTLSVDQSWWGFKARKTTYLYYNQVKPQPIKIRLEPPETTVQNMNKGERSKMTIEFCQWLINHEKE